MLKTTIWNQDIELSERHINMVSIFVILVSGMFLFFGMAVASAVPLAFFLTSLLFMTGGRSSFILALGFLIVTIIFTILKKDSLAENAAVAVYYLLLFGTLLELIDDKLHLLYIRLHKRVKKLYATNFHA